MPFDRSVGLIVLLPTLLLLLTHPAKAQTGTLAGVCVEGEIGRTAHDELGYAGPIQTSIEQVYWAEMPSESSLKQNYPNLFNPVTTVEFDLDRAQNVTLTVFDDMVRRVAVVVNDQKAIGTSRVPFDASTLSRKFHLYRLGTHAKSLTRKMTLLK
jgi:hypothetical protein